MKPRKIIILVIILVAMGGFFYLDLQQFLTLDSLTANRMILREYYASHKVLVTVGFIAVYILQTALSLPGATILSLAAGAIFGTVLGTVYAVTAASLGATLAFLVARYLLRDLVQAKFGGKLEKVNRELEIRGLNYLLFLRLVPLFPFFLINLAAGTTRLPLRIFFWGTFAGIIPGALVYVNAGASLAAISSPDDIASPRVLWSFALLGLFILIPVFYGKSRKQAS